ncbi:hypothetical protein ACL58G_19450 [Massilia sp. GER05]|uniref:hypothetical protein n=1 Tax=Massilia sp. GER05 TaxID=3394605 RepID=UPI003F84E34A
MNDSAGGLSASGGERILRARDWTASPLGAPATWPPALVKSLVELHDGTVSARSDGPGRGSRFTVVLARRLRALPGMADVPLVAVSGYGQARAATRRRSRAGGNPC